MKKLLSLLLVLAIANAFAQAPKKMNYQGAARDAQGNVMVDKSITLRLHVISGDDINTPVYSELQQTKTNSFGLFSLKIGEGEVLGGSFDAIEWGNADHFISVEMDAENNGHFQTMGVSQLLSVPYAFYAEKSGTARDLENADQYRDIPFSGTSGQTIRSNGSEWEASSTLFNISSNIGIGTTVPSEKLHVGGNINLSAGNEVKVNGQRALKLDANRNLMQGDQSGLSLTSGVNNNFIGDRAGRNTTSGSNNSFVGYRAGLKNTTGSANMFLGYRAGHENTVGGNNFFGGLNAGYGSINSIHNIAIGTNAGYSVSGGQNNIFLGREAGYSTTSNDNVFIGYNAGTDNTVGSSNTFIGAYADGASSSLVNATAIGANAVVAQDSSIVLGNAAKVGIGTNAPTQSLHVVGNARFSDAIYDGNNDAGTSGQVLSSTGAGTDWVDMSNPGWTDGGTKVWLTNSGDSVGIGTSNPLDKFHIMGSTTMASMMLTPNEPFSGDDASIILSEDDDNTYNMNMTYDGGDNRLYFYGKNNSTINGPHMGINRDNGRVGIGVGLTNPVSELEVVGTITATAFDGGDASGLVNVYADSLRGSMQADTNDLLQWNGTQWAPIPYGRYGFHASASTDQTVGDTAYDTLRCNNSSSGENFEYPAGVYDNATYAFIAPVDGIYFFEAAVLWDNATTAETRNAIFIRVNNTDEVGEWSASGGLDFFGTGVSTTLELNAGDEVRVRVYNGDSADMDTFSQSGKYCYFSGFMVFAQ